MKVSQLKKNPNNPRQIKGEKLELLKKSVGSFQKMMELRPIVVDENNVVLGGNMRLAAIKALGLKEIPDSWVKRADDLTDDEKREFVIKDNAGFGEWDWDVLANEWDAGELTEWGLDVPDFEAIADAGDADAEPQIDKAAELNKKWKVKSGDLWQIGEHRLLCGDSTKRDDVERVTTSTTIGSVVTDPPYGLGKNIENDGADEWLQVLSGSVGLFPDCRWFVFCASSPELMVQACAVVKPNRILIWNKPFNLTPPAFGIAWHFEPILFKANSGKPIATIGDVISEAAIQTKSHIESQPHPTQKPQNLITHLIETSEGDVYEPFAGSGTTLVACQNLNRKCYAIEISENYCAVILERMATAFPDLEIKRLEQFSTKGG